MLKRTFHPDLVDEHIPNGKPKEQFEKRFVFEEGANVRKRGVGQRNLGRVGVFRSADVENPMGPLAEPVSQIA